jgi:E3 ubiquitin-protein ligase RBBP6
MALSLVHYKFKSQKDFDSLTFDGMFISVGELKRQIVEKKGLARDQACELLLTNAQSNEGAPTHDANPFPPEKRNAVAAAQITHHPRPPVSAPPPPPSVRRAQA